MNNNLTQHPTIQKIVNLVPADLRDTTTGVQRCNEVRLNEHISIKPKFKNVKEPGLGVTTVLCNVILKAGGARRERTYTVDNDGDKPVSFHFWKVVRTRSEKIQSTGMVE